MGKLVTNLLDLSHIENAKNYNFKEINLSNFVESIILTNESLFYESKIKLKYHVTPNIRFNCDKGQIEQLIGILIDNATKYADKNSQVTINLNKENHKISLTFTNKGAPIKKDEKDKIFERFYRSDKTRSRKNGSYGLGLAIAKTIVENHNGTISVNSKNHYITFKIVF